ncbi:MAG TPA: PP2C family protein-serine/threonine phosphatase [Sedimentisphaerales bacterium]|nr:PP2C family protein-serine/threonine phosphatase [Sedimentisphaerales bacterium]HNU30014.1 PP2C family protein-serine/threonine phosphatase [Sedimentisphaerales bacterium]
MGLRKTADDMTTPEDFIDVVYLSDKPQMPPEIRRLFRQKKLTCQFLPLDQYSQIRARTDRIGTVLVDAEGIDISRDQQLGRVLEALERDNIGIVLLTQRIKRPVRSFSLVSSETSFSMANSVDSISLDDLWASINVNLAHRKRQHSGITTKAPGPTSLSERLWDKKPADPAEAHGSFVDSVKEQLRLAGLLQRDFLPAQLPNSDDLQWAVTFLPAEWVSGDIYDVARIDEQHIGFYVADAVGHSMPAALLTMFIKQALVMRQTTEKNYRIFSPAEVIKNLNTKMAGQKLSGYQFATCCYCLLNVKTRQLTFARAGHPYPILLRKGEPPRQLEARGSLLGIFESAEFLQESVQLQSGDRLLLYSDGAELLVGRLHDKAGFQFAEEFLAMKDCPIAEIVDRLTEQARSRDIDPAEVDDLTLVGLEIH